MKSETKLSHIIIIVDKTIEKQDVCAFCTNVNKSFPEIRFTYHSYDNQITDDIYNLFKNISEPAKELFVITDSQELINYANNNKMASAGLYTPDNKKAGLSGVLYCIEDLEYMDFDRILKMWQRYYNIPWLIMETERLIIREQTTRDIDALYEIYSDPEISRYTENLYSDKDEEYSYMVDYINNQYRYHEYGIWALVDKTTGKLIGRAGLSLRPGCDDPELGFVIGKDYQKKGYCYEACKAIIEYAFEELCADRVVSLTDKRNKASIGLLKKLGFTCCSNGGMYVFSLTKQ